MIQLLQHFADVGTPALVLEVTSGGALAALRHPTARSNADVLLPVTMFRMFMAPRYNEDVTDGLTLAPPAPPASSTPSTGGDFVTLGNDSWWRSHWCALSRG
jgi:hypothetical protein